MLSLLKLRQSGVVFVCCLAFVLASCQEEPTASLSSLSVNDRGLSPTEVVERPLTDFTNYQAPTSWFDSENPTYWLTSDYTGYYNRVFGLNLGTTFEGKILESALDDGTARVTITLHGTNVLTWCSQANFPYSLVFGYNPGRVRLGATPALGECTLRWEFINPAPGAPIPAFGSSGTILFEAKAFGELRAAAGLGPDGTLGKAWTTQVGLLGGVKPNPPLDDAYPAEFVKIKRVEPRMVGKD